MFAVTLRFAAGLAIGAATALWLARPKTTAQPAPDRPRSDRLGPPAADDHLTTTDLRTPGRAVPQRFSDYRPDADGRVEDSALIDGAIEDTFPASDPPAFMQNVVAGPPPHEEAAAVQRRQQGKRADQDAFAE